CRDPRQIRASAVCQREFRDDRETMRPQKPCNPSADLEGDVWSGSLAAPLNLRGQVDRHLTRRMPPPKRALLLVRLPHALSAARVIEGLCKAPPSSGN